MSAPNSPLLVESSPDSPALLYRRISRALDYAEGFWLGFAKCNLPPQRRVAVNACRQLLDPLNVRILELQLDHTSSDILPMIEDALAAAQAEFQKDVNLDISETEDSPPPSEPPKWAVFVYGLEYSIKSVTANAPILSYLNINREWFQQKLPHALLVWLPEYALTALSRQAPDFWAWRSGLYEFGSEPESVKQLSDPLQRLRHYSSSLTGSAKRESLAMLKGLLSDYSELERGRHEILVEHRILIKVGLLHQELGEYVEANHSFKTSLEFARELENEKLILAVKHRLARLAHIRGDYSEAAQMFTENVQIARASNAQSEIAFSLYQLGRFEQELGDLGKAKSVLTEGLDLRNATGNNLGVVLFLIQLGKVETKRSNYPEAKRLFRESLKISKDHELLPAIAQSLDGLAMLSRRMGDLYGAQKLIESSLSVRRDIHDRFGESISLVWLGIIKHELGYNDEARRLLKKTVKLKQKIDDPKGEAYVLRRLAEVCRNEGLRKEAQMYEQQARAILTRLGFTDYQS